MPTIQLTEDTINNVISAITKIEKALDPSVKVEDVPELLFSELHSIILLRKTLSKVRAGAGTWKKQG